MWMEREEEEARGAVPLVSVTFISQVIFDAEKNLRRVVSKLSAATSLWANWRGRGRLQRWWRLQSSRKFCRQSQMWKPWMCVRGAEPCMGREPGFTPFCCLTCNVGIFSLPQFIFKVPLPPPQACEISPLFLRRYSYLSFLHLHQLQSILSHLCVIQLPLKENQ